MHLRQVALLPSKVLPCLPLLLAYLAYPVDCLNSWRAPWEGLVSRVAAAATATLTFYCRAILTTFRRQAALPGRVPGRLLTGKGRPACHHQPTDVIKALAQQLGSKPPRRRKVHSSANHKVRHFEVPEVLRLQHAPPLVSTLLLPPEPAQEPLWRDCRRSWHP